ncbi:MAG: peptidylprolyl isomerase [Thermodesulfovibrionales bacterium]|nr:peptidylprolyl isomerase [Thermodesulfovibrionales bacterium]
MLRLKAFICVLIIVVSCGVSSAAILLDKVIAVVNQEVITWSDLYKAMEFEASDKIKDIKEEEKRTIFKENEGPFLEVLIDMKLQIQAAKQKGIDAAAEEIAEAINDIKKKYSMDEQTLTASLKKEGFTLDEYKKKLAEQIILSRVVSQEVRNKIVFSDAEIAKYIEKSKDTLITDDAYRIRQIFFRKPKSPGDSDRKTMEEKAGTVYQQIKAGENFASLAQKHSEDPSGKAGGDLGFIKKGQMAKEFTDVLSQMKAGDISQPFWTDMGLHIIKLEEKIEKQSAAAIKESAKNKLTEQRFPEKYKHWISELRETAYIEIRL